MKKKKKGTDTKFCIYEVDNFIAGNVKKISPFPQWPIVSQSNPNLRIFLTQNSENILSIYQLGLCKYSFFFFFFFLIFDLISFQKKNEHGDDTNNNNNNNNNNNHPQKMYNNIFFRLKMNQQNITSIWKNRSNNLSQSKQKEESSQVPFQVMQISSQFRILQKTTSRSTKSSGIQHQHQQHQHQHLLLLYKSQQTSPLSYFQ